MKYIQTVYLVVLVSLIASLSSCLKKDFDEPPYIGNVDPNLPVNISIKDLKAKYDLSLFSRPPLGITEDLTIYGIVTANDESGNFYKQIMIQDSTGAIAVNINRTNLYGDFPVGRRVYVKCKGLSLGDYGKFIQLGYGTDGSGGLGDIPTGLVDQYVVKGSFPHVVQPLLVSPGDINTVVANEDKVGMLIQFDRVQFESGEFGKSYAETPTVGSGTNRNLKDCNDATIILRTSNYAAFQASLLPTGSGSLIGIYSRFNNDAQILIRDLKDVKFDQDRCPFGTANDSLMSIGDLRNMFTGTPVMIQNRKIRGVVISDLDNNLGSNITSRNLVLQDGNSGIVLRFASSGDNTFALNDSIEVIISGHTLSEFGRLLQVGDMITANHVQVLGKGAITPREATIAEIVANFEAWESTLVTIKNATVVSASNSSVLYQGTVLLNDGSTPTDFPHFTQTYAAFANVPAPVGQVKDVTGFLYSISSADRISIRRLTDVKP